jgi:hypothetical protein
MPIIVDLEDMPGGITGNNLPRKKMAGIFGTGYMLNQGAQYRTSTGMVTISTANTNLDGTGTLGTVITANVAENGMLLKNVTIKASTSAKQGMVRLFLYDGTNTRLLLEVEVKPETIQSGIAHSFERSLDLNYWLKPGYTLKASTEKADTFNVIAEGLDWIYP